MTRLYVLAETNMGHAAHEFQTGADRRKFLSLCDNSIDNYYILDVAPDGSILFDLADVEGARAETTVQTLYPDDYGLSAEGLELKYSAEGDGEHPGYPREDWRDEVRHEGTNAGYWDWVYDKLLEEEVDNDFPSANGY